MKKYQLGVIYRNLNGGQTEKTAINARVKEIK